MPKTSADEIILSYNDCVLRQSDLAILNSPSYLNDRIIEFYFSYLSSCHPSEHILLVPPSIAYWTMNCPDTDSLKEFLQPLNLPSKKLIIFPVNDNDDVAAAGGGSHWSLLAYEKTTNVFVHHDSLGSSNQYDAKRLYESLIPHMAIAKEICKWFDSNEEGNDHLWFSRVKEQVNALTVPGLRSEILELIKDLREKK
nr:NEDD8-specific protease 1 [Tanacetum cinerariifolium]